MKLIKFNMLNLTACITIFLFPLFAMGQQFFNDYKTTLQCDGPTPICGQLPSPHSSKTVLGPDGYYKMVIENGVTGTVNILTKIDFDGNTEFSKVGIGSFGIIFVNSTSTLHDIEVSDLIYHNDHLYVSYNVNYSVSSPGPDIFHFESHISKLDLNGNTVWESIFQHDVGGNPFGVNLIVNDMELTNNGIAYVGTRVEDAGTTKLVYGKVDFDGNPIFSNTYNDGINGYSTRGLTIKRNKALGEGFTLYIGGTYGNDSGVPDNLALTVFLMGIESDGDVRWGRHLSNITSFPGFSGFSSQLGRKLPMSQAGDLENTEIFLAGMHDFSLEDFDLIKVRVDQGWVSTPLTLRVDYSPINEAVTLSEILYSGKGNFVGAILNGGGVNTFDRSTYVRVNFDDASISISRLINNNSKMNSIFLHNTPGVGTQFLIGGLYIKNGIHTYTLTRLSPFGICDFVPITTYLVSVARKMKFFQLNKTDPDFYQTLKDLLGSPIDGDFSQNELCDYLLINDFQGPTDGELGMIQNSTLQESKNRTSAFFPNPMSEESSIQLMLEFEKEVTFNVYNSLGQLVLSKNYGKLTGNQLLDLDVSGLEVGVYFVHILMGNELVVKQVSIVR